MGRSSAWLRPIILKPVTPFLVLCYLVLFPFAFMPQQVFANDPLELASLLASVRERFPLILAAEEDRQIAEGVEATALGEFDVRWKTRTAIISPGYYDRQILDSVIEKPTSLWGLDLYSGYRLGTGDFAIYDEKTKTTTGGEARLGMQLPLLRDRAIDARRAGLAVAAIGVDLAGQTIQAKKIESILKASLTYWKWVGFGKKLIIANDLLEIAKERDKGLRERVAHGDIAEFEQKDNQRGLLQRENQLLSVQRLFKSASFELSLYLRDDDGVARIPHELELPKIIPPTPREVAFQQDRLIADAMTRRPEVKRLINQRSQNEILGEQADNQLLPKLDLVLEVSKDMAGQDTTREPSELSSGIQLEIPLQRRKAQGKLAEAEAKQRKITRELEFIKQQIEVDIQDAVTALSISHEQIEIVGKELSFARELEEGERTRFQSGESTILIVNLREQATADSAIRQIDALVQYHMAEAYLQAALGKS